MLLMANLSPTIWSSGFIIEELHLRTLYTIQRWRKDIKRYVSLYRMGTLSISGLQWLLNSELYYFSVNHLIMFLCNATRPFGISSLPNDVQYTVVVQQPQTILELLWSPRLLSEIWESGAHCAVPPSNWAGSVRDVTGVSVSASVPTLTRRCSKRCTTRAVHLIIFHLLRTTTRGIRLTLELSELSSLLGLGNKHSGRNIRSLCQPLILNTIHTQITPALPRKNVITTISTLPTWIFRYTKRKMARMNAIALCRRSVYGHS